MVGGVWARLRNALRGVPATALTLAFAALVIAAAWASALLLAARDRAEQIRAAYADNAGLARAFEEHVRRVVMTADNALLFLQAEYEKQGSATDGMRTFVERARHDPILNQIGLAGPDGTLLLSAVPLRKPVNIAHRDHFKAQAGDPGAGLYIAKPLMNLASGAWSIFLSRRLSRPDGSFAGVVTAGLDPRYFSGYYSDAALGPSRSVALVGRDGIVRAQQSGGSTAIGQDMSGDPLFARIGQTPAGSFEAPSPVDGRRLFRSYRALAEYPLVVTVGELADTALAPSRRHARTLVAATAAFTVFVALSCALLVRAQDRVRRQNRQLARELAERARAEESLRESEGLFSAFMEHLPAAVFVKDERGAVRYANQAFRQFSGDGPVGPETPPARPCDPSAAPSAPEGDRRAMREDAVVGEETRPDGAGGVRVFETRTFRVDRGGKEPLLGGIAVDITARRRDEEQRLEFERRIQQAQKLESLGILAGGIAHDFNNLLMAILGNTDLALVKTSPESPARPYLRSIGTAAQRAADLTNQMLAYSGKGRFVVESVNLSRLVGEMGHLLATVVSKRATLRCRLAEDLPPVAADATQIRQVVMNLITNASDALGEGDGVISVATGAAESDPDYLAAFTSGERLAPGRYVFFEVSDTGQGMDRATQRRIFDPFFTTKHTGRGLGLAAVLGIVRGHRGGIKIYSEPGRGTSVKVLLPASDAPDAPADARPETTAAAPAAAGHGLVLVVDDEDSVRATASAMLRECGYDVCTAADGVEALAALRARGSAIGAVLLDMTMPHMGGEETFREIRRIAPAMPVVLSSGYTEQDAVNRFSGKGLAGFIQKPYRLETLAATLRAAAPPP